MRTHKRREAFLQARENVDQQYAMQVNLQKKLLRDHIHQKMLQY